MGMSPRSLCRVLDEHPLPFLDEYCRPFALIGAMPVFAHAPYYTQTQDLSAPGG